MAPWDLQWIDPQRRWKGVYMEVLPLAVMVVRKEDSWRVTEGLEMFEVIEDPRGGNATRHAALDPAYLEAIIGLRQM